MTFLWIFFVIGSLGAAVTIWLGVRLWKRRTELALPTKLAASVAVAAAMSGALGTLLGAIKAFGAVGGESVDPSQRALILAEGISEAMNWIAFSLVVWSLSIVVTVLLVVRAAKKDRESPNR